MAHAARYTIQKNSALTGSRLSVDTTPGRRARFSWVGVLSYIAGEIGKKDPAYVACGKRWAQVRRDTLCSAVHGGSCTTLPAETWFKRVVDSMPSSSVNCWSRRDQINKIQIVPILRLYT